MSRRLIPIAVTVLAVLLAVGLSLYSGTDSALADLTQQVREWQHHFQRNLSLGMVNYDQQEGPQTAALLMLLGFGYGVFHALGPGHGKAVITTYLLTHPTALRRGLWLSSAAALLQGVVAIALTGLLVGVLGWLTRDSMAGTVYLEQASFGLVALLGGWLVYNAAHKIRAAWPAAPSRAPLMQYQPTARPLISRGPAASPTDCGCGKTHHIDPVAAGTGWRSQLVAVFAIGLRPCSGAIMLLGVSAMLGHWWPGVLAVLAMSAGTALTTASLASLAVMARGHVQRLFKAVSSPWPGLAGHTAALAGGLVILMLGIALMISGVDGAPSSRGPL
ncbi:nickel/cobalt transporter [Larsenimonas rhizosphaerae]|uniref:Nickel/cobalt efflux system n=1 Tax=Larsenimonas rhizosphaerae TaxID=2944682 RepID=A0AA41ZIC9_9GAMM|nr:nickel/cobalt transporter [Larsenimonas rhizosphaerae]MCM2131950.1 nickel/cobalt transporter [Larsenimonas rhizosphaerae]MCX2524744.1 nickel/cobalt transporter [Larsenimonas rhizosphaerae]